MTITIAPNRLLAIAAILLLAVLSIGGALAQRIEARAATDRLTIGAASVQSDAAIAAGSRLG